jgi:hypothetical protein
LSPYWKWKLISITSLSIIILFPTYLLAYEPSQSESFKAYGLSQAKNVKQQYPQPILRFLPWGGPPNKLTITTEENSSLPGYVINGSTGERSVGFSSYRNFNGSYLSFVLGDIVKRSGDPAEQNPQISFVFYLNGTHAQYQLVFVNGHLSHEGWSNNSYYTSVVAHTSSLINLKKLLAGRGDSYSSLQRVIITFEKKMVIDPIEFALYFYNDSFPYTPAK